MILPLHPPKLPTARRWQWQTKQRDNSNTRHDDKQTAFITQQPRGRFTRNYYIPFALSFNLFLYSFCSFSFMDID